jgi:hypothetical protein
LKYYVWSRPVFGRLEGPTRVEIIRSPLGLAVAPGTMTLPSTSSGSQLRLLGLGAGEGAERHPVGEDG